MMSYYPSSTTFPYGGSITRNRIVNYIYYSAITNIIMIIVTILLCMLFFNIIGLILSLICCGLLSFQAYQEFDFYNNWRRLIPQQFYSRARTLTTRGIIMGIFLNWFMVIFAIIAKNAISQGEMEEGLVSYGGFPPSLQQPYYPPQQQPPLQQPFYPAAPQQQPFPQSPCPPHQQQPVPPSPPQVFPYSPAPQQQPPLAYPPSSQPSYPPSYPPQQQQPPQPPAPDPHHQQQQ